MSERLSIIDNEPWQNKKVPIADVIAALREAKKQGYTLVTVGGSGDGLSSWLDAEKPGNA
jgi:hypothetical protein